MCKLLLHEDAPPALERLRRCHLAPRLLDERRRLAAGAAGVMAGAPRPPSAALLFALEDALAALVAALFLDGGMDAASDFVRRTFAEELANPDKIEAIKNPKGELQELLQAESEEAPTYELLSSTGPDHDRKFEVVVKHLGQALGQGKGSSKKAAETEAALAALAKAHDS